MPIPSPIKYHGGKHYLAKWIISLMPPRCANPNKPSSGDKGWLHYVEPYFGGGSVLFANDPEGISEVVNDLNGEVTNFFKVLRAPELYEAMQHRLDVMPFAQQEFVRCGKPPLMPKDRVDRAIRFFVRNRQSRQGLGRDFATLTRNRTRRGMNEQASAWLAALDGLPTVVNRMRRVIIMQGPAVPLIEQQDGPRTLFYLDPTYVQHKRTTGNEYGPYEMTLADHRELLECLVGLQGRWLLSGYRSKLYDVFAYKHGWTRHEKRIDIKASSAKTKRKGTECVWTNY